MPVTVAPAPFTQGRGNRVPLTPGTMHPEYCWHNLRHHFSSSDSCAFEGLRFIVCFPF